MKVVAMNAIFAISLKIKAFAATNAAIAI